MIEALWMMTGEVSGVHKQPTQARWNERLQRRGRPALLVSVADAEEAAEALLGGAQVIDVKDPTRGALGMPERGAFISVCERVAGAAPVTLALGEAGEASRPGWGATVCADWDRAAFAKAAAVGSDWRRGLSECLAAVAPERRVAAVYVDRVRRGGPGVEEVLAWAIDAGAAGVLLDTRAKDGRCLFDHAEAHAVAAWVASARSAGLLIALAGSLRGEALGLASAIDPDLVAVRGAACVGGDRGGRVHRTAVAQALGWVQHDRSGVTRA